MKLSKLKIKNFRCYEDETIIELNDLMAFIGKNDAGKSTILEALDIFFEGGVVKIDKDDINKNCYANGDDEIVIAACFSNIDSQIILDRTNATNLSDEYLLNIDNELEIIKKFKGGSKTPKIYIRAFHPINENCNDLLLKKNAELKKIIENNNINCENKNVNATMRKAIWEHFNGYRQREIVDIDVSKGDDVKSIWESLKSYLPLYFLFQSDRKNSDSDNEVQDPLKIAVEQILSSNELKNAFETISITVRNKLNEVANETLEKLKALNADLANSLIPKIPENLEWRKAFGAVSIASDNEIPINKRGSGVKRLILLSFFQSQAEKKKTENNGRGIIYAIEEPETSQHFDHQRILIKALTKLTEQDSTQVFITTHSSTIVKELDFNNIRLICSELESNKKVIKNIERHFLPTISLNEINYLAFSEISFEYHQELYAYLQNIVGEKYQDKFNNILCDKYNIKKTEKWIKENKNGDIIEQDATLPYYIRNKIDHPENKHNPNNVDADKLEKSIKILQEICDKCNS